MTRTNFFINLLKPTGMTSHDAVNSIRKIFSEKKTGHLGTLDPGAVGVLPIAVGSHATRLIEYLQAKIKGYRAEFTLGKVSDTDDLYGNITTIEPQIIPTEEAVKNALKEFEGEILQTPPASSAIQINGVRLYKYFRKGIDVEIPKRKVTIYSAKLVKYDYPKVIADIECQEGTYIRSIASDLGKKLNCGGLMSFLIRYKSGQFHISNAFSIEELKLYSKTDKKIFVTISEAMSDYPDIMPNEQIIEKVKNGNEFYWENKEQFANGQLLKILDQNKDVLAIGKVSIEQDKTKIKCEKVLYK